MEIFLFITLGYYHEKVLQLLMVISGYYTWNGKPDLCVAYLHELHLIPACVHKLKQPSSEEWLIATAP
jgi:hypothetical protein